MYNIRYSPIIDINHNCLTATDYNIYPSSKFISSSSKINYPKNSNSACEKGYSINSELSGDYTSSPNILLLTPVIFGSTAAFILGFNFYGHSLSGGYNKFIFFMNVFAIIASIGVGAYIYKQRLRKHSLCDIIVPAIILIFFFATIFNLTYSLYPDTFTGTIGDTKLTQFISFLSISIGAISVGETLNVTPNKASTQILVAVEALFSLFALSLIIAIVAF